MKLKEIPKSTYAERVKPADGDLVVTVRKNNSQTPYLIFRDEELKKYRLINMHSGYSNYSGEFISDAVHMLTDEKAHINPLQSYFFVRSSDFHAKAEDAFGHVELNHKKSSLQAWGEELEEKRGLELEEE